MARNTCRNPAVRRLDMRLAKRMSIAGRRAVELSADVFNVANLLRGEWGVYRQTAAGETVALLMLTGWDGSANRPLYTVPSQLPERNAVVRDLSRWRMQLGARLDF